ncbi:MAG: quinolinate synthase NadA [Bdellovibrionales bacterium]|nr:quinolinate synthase NadA [Bdellovibrionales bacterium]
MTQQKLIEDIKALKKEHNALILAHYYQEDAIQDIADYCGDSLFLAQMGQKSEAPVIVLAGVVFMGESVKILSPTKTVLVPDFNAGCSLVSGTPYEDFVKWRQKYPEHIAVTYINSSAAVKSVSDAICTSSNAEKIINSIPRDRGILFGPDKNLGRFLERKTGREMIEWPGQCEVHVLFSAKKLFTMKEENPGALVLAHPECEDAVLAYADFIGSTSGILNEVKTNKSTDTFIVATETGIFYQLQKARPEAKLIQAPFEGGCQCNDCPYMKLNSLEKIHKCLSGLSNEVQVDPNLIEKARLPLQRMMDITDGKPVIWPTWFEG